MKPFDLHGLQTYPLRDRPSKVFIDDLGKPLGADASMREFVDALPKQLAGNTWRRVCDHLARCHAEKRGVAVAMGGHVIKTGCTPYLIDWINRGLVTSISMNGSAAIHDFELAFAGKTSEDVTAQLPEGRFGMARETADAFAVAARQGAQHDIGLGQALGRHMHDIVCPHADASVVLAAFRKGIPCTIHVALGTDIVHMHPHVSGAALGEASMIDFRKVCTIVAGLDHGMWFNIGSAVVMPEVFLKAVSVVRNFGHGLEGLITVNMDKESRYRTLQNVLFRPAAEGLELVGHHELQFPLLHAVLTSRLAGSNPTSRAA